MKKNPMLDKQFLKDLFYQKRKYTYARVTSYTNDENPVESIEGRVTSGTINLDGKSSSRRTCSLSIASSPDLRLEDELNWALNTKIKVEIGLQNLIDTENYDEVIWFNMGFYCISNFSFAKSTAGCTVSLQAKDKMCLLNGDLGGEIYAAVDFGTEYITDKTTGEVTPRQIPIEDIIRESVYEYAKEPYYNINIEDIPKFGLYLLDYMGGTPFYILVKTDNTNEAADVLFNQIVYKWKNNTWNNPYELDALKESEVCNIDSFLNQSNWNDLATIKLSLEDTQEYHVCKIDNGETCGFEVTDLTYPKESEEDNSLSIGVGGTITQVLDKIVEFLGDYEYFFNTNGQFVFRKKNHRISTNDWSEIDTQVTGIGNDYDLEPAETNWNFSEEEIVTQYNVSQKLGNIRNDFSIWGNKKSLDTEIPIHLRYAIDFKPQFYRSINMSADEIAEYVALYPEYKDAFEYINGDYIAGQYSPVESKIYYSKDCPFDINDEKKSQNEKNYEVDWREIIYQMAKDYLKFKHFDQFLSRLEENNYVKAEDRYLYPKGVTKYEQYYVDLEAFWRGLYAPRSQYEDDNGEMTLVSKDEIKFVDNNDLPVPIYIKDRWYVQDSQNPYSDSEGPTPNNHEGYDIYVNSGEEIDELILTKNPTNLDLKKYLNYDDVLLTNALSCFSINRGNTQVGYSDPGYFFRMGLTDTVHDWSFQNWLRLASRPKLNSDFPIYEDKPQFMNKGMGIFCDNYTNNSSTHFELFIDFKSKGFLPFNEIMSSYPGGTFSSRSVAKTDRYNLIIPVKTYFNIDHDLNIKFLRDYNYDLEHYAEGDYSFASEELEWATFDDTFFDFYKIFKVNNEIKYQTYREYQPGDRCQYFLEAPLYGHGSPISKYKKYYKGDIVIFKDPDLSPLQERQYKCLKDTDYRETNIRDEEYWEIIDTQYVIYQCINSTTGTWKAQDWYTDNTLEPSQSYIMLDSIESYQNHNWRTLNKFVRVIPTYEGIKYADSGEYVYKLSVMSYTTDSFDAAQDNNKQFYSRVTSIEDLENYASFKNETYHFTVKQETAEGISYPMVVKKQYIDYNQDSNSGIVITDPPYQGFIMDYARDYRRAYFYTGQGISVKPRYYQFLKQNNEQYLPDSNVNYPWGYWYWNMPYDSSAKIGIFSPFSSGDDSQRISSETIKENYRFTDLGRTGHVGVNDIEVPIEYYQKKTTYKFEPYPDSDWNVELLNNPEQMIFWFDFLHSEKNAQISKYGADKIMDRAKSETVENATAICFRDILNIVYDFGDSSEQLVAEAAEAQQAIFNIPNNLKSNFVVSDKSRSCKDVLDEWMWRYTYSNDTISLSAVPIYFLEPNNRILTPDGEQVINSVSFSLIHNGLMNINATKAIDKLQ